MWWRKSDNKNSKDRKALIKSFAEEMYFIDQKWPAENKAMLGLFLAIDWRLFLLQFRSIGDFSLLSRDDQLDYFSKLLESSADQKAEADRLRDIQPNVSLDHFLQQYSARFLSRYLLCVIEDDKEWRKTVVASLNPFIRDAWKSSTAIFPTGNSLLDEPFAIEME